MTVGGNQENLLTSCMNVLSMTFLCLDLELVDNSIVTFNSGIR